MDRLGGAAQVVVVSFGYYFSEGWLSFALLPYSAWPNEKARRGSGIVIC